MAAFLESWFEYFPDAPPVSHALRTAFPNRWLRVHSLPGSKRYADTPAEYEIVLGRQNQLLDELIGRGNTFQLAYLPVEENDICFENYERVYSAMGPWQESTFKYESHFRSIGEESVLQGRKLRHRPMTWQNGWLDYVFKAIADDEIRALMVNMEARRVIAPYDGGVDIIAANRIERDTLKKRYSDWLSAHPKGL